jgi:hypothetical protein
MVVNTFPSLHLVTERHPMIADDPLADNTDVYAFGKPQQNHPNFKLHSFHYHRECPCFHFSKITSTKIHVDKCKYCYQRDDIILLPYFFKEQTKILLLFFQYKIRERES